MKNETIINEVLCEKFNDLMTPGVVIEFDPIEADNVGAFREDAINELDAYDSMVDLIKEEP